MFKWLVLTFILIILILTILITFVFQENDSFKGGDNTDENKGMDNKRELNNYADKQIFDVR